MRPRSPKRHFLRYVDRGDTKALGRAFDAVAPELLALAIHLARDVSVAEDALQDTFLAALESAERFDRTRDLEPWLVGILVNRVRRARSGRSSFGEEVLERLAGQEEDPGRALEAREIADLVAGEIEGLDEPYRAVVRAHLTEGQAPLEIARGLDRAPGTVRAQLHRGLARLRERLAQGGERHAIGRASALLAANPNLLDGTARGNLLEALRDEVMDTGARLAVPTAEGSVVARLALAALAAVAVVAGGAWALRAPPETAVPPTRTASLEDRSVDALTRLESVSPAEPNRATRAQKGRTAPLGTAANTPSDFRSKRRDRVTTRSEGTAKAPGSASFPACVEPLVNVLGQKGGVMPDHVRMSARLPGDSLGSLGDVRVTWPHETRLGIGSFASASAIPASVIFRFDHPGFFPQEIEITPAQFSRDPKSEGWVARVTVDLHPTQNELDVLALGSKSHATHLQLVTVDPRTAAVRFHDRATVEGVDLHHVRMRFRKRPGETYLLCVATDEPSSAGYAIAFDPGRRSLSILGCAVTPPFVVGPRKLTVEGPFGDPLSGARITARLAADTERFVGSPGAPPARVLDRALCKPARDWAAAVRSALDAEGEVHQAFLDLQLALAQDPERAKEMQRKFETFGMSGQAVHPTDVFVLLAPELEVTTSTAAVEMPGLSYGLHHFDVVTSTGLRVTRAPLVSVSGPFDHDPAPVPLDLPLAGLVAPLPESLREGPEPSFEVRMGTAVLDAGFGLDPRTAAPALRALAEPGALVEFELRRDDTSWKGAAFGAPGAIRTVDLVRRRIEGTDEVESEEESGDLVGTEGGDAADHGKAIAGRRDGR